VYLDNSPAVAARTNGLVLETLIVAASLGEVKGEKEKEREKERVLVQLSFVLLLLLCMF